MPFNVFNIIVGFDSDITTELINNYINDFYMACQCLFLYGKKIFPDNIQKHRCFSQIYKPDIIMSVMRYSNDVIQKSINNNFKLVPSEKKNEEYTLFSQILTTISQIWIYSWIKIEIKMQQPKLCLNDMVTTEKHTYSAAKDYDFKEKEIIDHLKNNQDLKQHNICIKEKLPSCSYWYSLLKNSIRNDPKTSKDHNDKKNKRRALRHVEKFILYTFLSGKVPHYLTNNKDLEDDHIVPISTTNYDNQIDLNRLGNRMYIPKTTNNEKSNKKLTPDFIKKHGLDNFFYPTEEQLNKIYKKNENKNDCENKNDYEINSNEFNSYCHQREKNMYKFVYKYIRNDHDD
jgi:hypothetical protein